MDVHKMRFVSKKNITKLVIAIWLILWVNFILRDLIKKEDLEEYAALFKATREGRYSIVYGPRYYEFLKYAKNNIPKGSTYDFIDVETYSIDHRRGVYYLYPLLPEKEDPEYLLGYKTPAPDKDRYYLYKNTDAGYFLLKERD